MRMKISQEKNEGFELWKKKLEENFEQKMEENRWNTINCYWAYRISIVKVKNCVKLLWKSQTFSLHRKKFLTLEKSIFGWIRKLLLKVKTTRVKWLAGEGKVSWRANWPAFRPFNYPRPILHAICVYLLIDNNKFSLHSARGMRSVQTSFSSFLSPEHFHIRETERARQRQVQVSLLFRHFGILFSLCWRKSFLVVELISDEGSFWVSFDKGTCRMCKVLLANWDCRTQTKSDLNHNSKDKFLITQKPTLES